MMSFLSNFHKHSINGLPMVAILLVVFSSIELAAGHGRLIEPPSRSSMWRYGFSTPPNYNDHELYCGGFTRQWQTNGGKCGICGDPWDEPSPRANEAGGRYGSGTITRKYRRDDTIRIKIELTANHMGHFEFRICPNNNPRRSPAQACLDKFQLRQSDGSGADYYPGPGNRVFEMMYQLPKGLTCTQCILQWRYLAGNNWGVCKNGTGAVGCGPQEEFRACSDIAIVDEDGSADSTQLSDNNYKDIAINNVVPETSWQQEEEDIHQKEEDLPDNKEPLAGHLTPEGIAIIVLATLLVTILGFLAIFFYYYKLKARVDAYLKEHDIEFPSVGPIVPAAVKDWRPPKAVSNVFARAKSANLSGFCSRHVGDHVDKLKLGRIAWPLSNISISDRLPNFRGAARSEGANSSVDAGPRRRPVVTMIPRSGGDGVAESGAAYKINAGLGDPEERSGQPLPPPRVKRGHSRSVSPANGLDECSTNHEVVMTDILAAPRPSLAAKAGSTISNYVRRQDVTMAVPQNSSNNNSRLATITPRPRPPPPPANVSESASASSPATLHVRPPLEISAPTGVTINGVSVSTAATSPSSSPSSVMSSNGRAASTISSDSSFGRQGRKSTASSSSSSSSRDSRDSAFVPVDITASDRLNGVRATGVQPPVVRPKPIIVTEDIPMMQKTVADGRSVVGLKHKSGEANGNGGLCAARPALVLHDMPDSSLDSSLPPPLPSCPPPVEDDEDDDLTVPAIQIGPSTSEVNDSTDA